jgi:hypothetical protein
MADLTSSASDQNSPERDEATAPYGGEETEKIFQQAKGPTDNDPSGTTESDEATALYSGDDDKPTTEGRGGDDEKPRVTGRGSALLTSDAVKALEDADERLTQEQGRVVRGGIKDVERMVDRMNSRPIPQMDKMPNAPEANLTQSMGPFLGIATALMALAGSRARQGGTVALNAFAGAVKGFQEGRMEDFKAKTEEFKMASTKVKEDNQEKLDQYKMAWANDKLNIDQKMSMIKMIAAQYGDEKAHNAAAMQNYQVLAQALDKEDQFQAQYEQKERLAFGGLDQMQSQAEMSKNAEYAAAYQSLGGKIPINMYGGKQAALFKQMVYGHLTKRDISPEVMQQAKDDIAAQQQTHASGILQAREAGAAGLRLGSIEFISNTLDQLTDPALEASNTYKRGRIVPLNSIIQKGQVIASDPALYDWGTLNLQLAEIWARAMNAGGQMREGDRDLALSRLNMAASPEAYRAVVQRIRGLVDIEKNSGAELRQQIGGRERDDLMGRGQSGGRPAAATPTARGPSQNDPLGIR